MSDNASLGVDLGLSWKMPSQIVGNRAWFYRALAMALDDCHQIHDKSCIPSKHRERMVFQILNHLSTNPKMTLCRLVNLVPGEINNTIWCSARMSSNVTCESLPFTITSKASISPRLFSVSNLHPINDKFVE